jgi:hypothetical protein
MRLVQFTAGDGKMAVGRVDEGQGTLTVLSGTSGTYDLAQDAIAAGRPLTDLVAERAGRETVDYAAVVAKGRLLAPLLHPDPAHLLVTGTGLTHLGSASARAAMHQGTAKGEEDLTDSMKMFRWGLEGGKPKPGRAGIQPEWFYKGDGGIVASPGHPLAMPDFSLDGGEEPEIVGLYVIGPDGTPFRLGFALGNEFSDHVTERQNYLYLAHSKLRPCSFGPELLLGELPGHVAGRSRILRAGKVLWEAEFVSGEDNMSHSIANLEHHHFKYPQFRRSGDAHCHFFGTATLSFAAGIKAVPGDVFEIEAAGFGLPLANPLAVADEAAQRPIRPL